MKSACCLADVRVVGCDPWDAAAGQTQYLRCVKCGEVTDLIPDWLLKLIDDLERKAFEAGRDITPWKRDEEHWRYPTFEDYKREQEK